MATFEWISIDDARKPEIADGEEASDEILVLCCNEQGYWWEIGRYYHDGIFIRHDDPVHCEIRYWAPLLIPSFPPKNRLRKDLAACALCFNRDAEECRQSQNKTEKG